MIMVINMTHYFNQVNGKQCGVAPSQDSDTLFVGNICKTWTKDHVSSHDASKS